MMMEMKSENSNTKELIDVLEQIISEWKQTDSILSYDSKIIKEKFEALNKSSWGYTGIPTCLAQILNLLKYEETIWKKLN